jgi:hypothetical protein
LGVKEENAPRSTADCRDLSAAVEGLEVLQTRLVFDWDEEGWQNFVTDPEVPAILQEAGQKIRPLAAGFGGQFDA